jgi:pimeloyl-ACP methyl ester carboxylesterase
MRRSFAALSALLALSPALAARAAQPPEKAPSRYARLDGNRVHYKSLGTGKTAVVLVHGWCSDMTFWDEQVPALAGKVRVVLIDLPGHGKSDRPKVEYTMDLFARAVDAVLKDAGVEQAVLAGHSMGTPVVRQFYRLFPKKTRALIAVDGALRPFTTDKALLEKFLSQFTGPDFKKNAGKFVEAMFTADTPARVREHIKARVQSADQRVAVSAMKNMLDPALWKEDRIEVPVLALMARSKFWGADYEAFVRKLAPKSEYRVMDGVGHFLMLERPAEFNAILVGFLKKQGVVADAGKRP